MTPPAPIRRSRPTPYPGNTWHTGIFVAQLAAEGSHVWSSALIADHDSTRIYSFHRGADGTLMLTGWGVRPVLPPSAEVWGSGDGPWVLALAPDGGPRWLHSLPEDARSVPRALATPDGAASVAFTAYGAVEVAGVAVGEAGRETLVLARFGP